MPNPKIDVGQLTEQETIGLFDACLDALPVNTILERLRAGWSLDERQRAVSALELEDD